MGGRGEGRGRGGGRGWGGGREEGGDGEGEGMGREGGRGWGRLCHASAYVYTNRPMVTWDRVKWRHVAFWPPSTRCW